MHIPDWADTTSDGDPAHQMDLLSVQNLAKRFSVRQSLTRRATVTAVDGLSFQVKAGHTVALVGESGCGKTTVGKLLLGLLEPDQGEIVYRGQALPQLLDQSPKVYRRAVQMVFQSPLASFNPMLTVGGTLLDAMRLRTDLDAAGKRTEMARLLQEVGLEPHFAQRYPAEMSGGQLQRVGIARALASKPDIIFLDEPTSALDMSIRGQIINLLLDLQAQYQLAYILVSHDLTVVRALAHYVLVMYLGQVVEDGPIGKVLAHPLHPYTQGLLAATLLGRDTEARQRSSVRVRGEVLQLPTGYAGCKLTRRCPFELDQCRSQPQTLQTIAADHRVRCWRATEIKHPDNAAAEAV